MIKEIFLQSEPNLCFWNADAATSKKKKNILKNILYNVTCMTETWKLKYIVINILWKYLPGLALYKFNAIPEVVAWGIL